MTSRLLALAVLSTVGCSAPERQFVNDNKSADTGRTDTAALDTTVAMDTTVVDTAVEDTGTIVDDFFPDTDETAVDAIDAADVKPDSVLDTYEAPPPSVEVTFPATGDTVTTKFGGPAFWNLGDFVQGSRTTTLAKATRISGTFEINNSLGSCSVDGGSFTGIADMRVFVNGVAVGIVPVRMGSPASIPYSFTFAAVTGPTFNIRYEEITQVASGCGSYTFKMDVAKVTLK